MNKPLHTPAPWVIGDECTEIMACPEGGRFHAIDAPRYGHFALAVVVTQMADDYPPGSTCAELMANANLIAAAPDLLAALKDLQVRYSAVFDLYSGYAYSFPEAAGSDLALALATSQAAIDKATGVIS